MTRFLAPLSPPVQPPPTWRARLNVVLPARTRGERRLRACAAALLACALPQYWLAAQVAPTAAQTYMRAQLELSDEEQSSLRAGRPVVKTLSATGKREMITVGGIRVESLAMARFVEQFKTLEGFRTSQFVLQILKFSPEPTLRDLDLLAVEADDIEAFKKCRVGACDVQLSADDIRRFNTQVDWRAPTATAQATALYKTILFEHLIAYRSGGLSRLIRYNDHEAPMSLSDETTTLLDARPSLLDQAPAFQRHLKSYPANPAPNVQEFFYWSKEEFGFKPVVGLNHVSVHTDAAGAVLIATTQIYASHYMDGSVAVNALIPDAGGGSGFYWLYANRSHIGRLGGLLGTLSRPIVQRRARAGLTKSLVQTKQRIEAGR